MKLIKIITPVIVLMLFTAASCSKKTVSNADNTQTTVQEQVQQQQPVQEEIPATKNVQIETASVTKSEEEWKKQLTPDEYKVLREKATEAPYSGEYEQFWDSGVYVCKACGNELFHSDTKFDAGCGWPSFFKTIDKSKIIEIPDYSHGMKRIEVQCARCHGHLGHVFDDGPDTTGLRYCINSLSLGFEKK